MSFKRQSHHTGLNMCISPRTRGTSTREELFNGAVMKRRPIAHLGREDKQRKVWLLNQAGGVGKANLRAKRLAGDLMNLQPLRLILMSTSGASQTMSSLLRKEKTVWRGKRFLLRQGFKETTCEEAQVCLVQCLPERLPSSGVLQQSPSPSLKGGAELMGTSF